MREKKIEKEKDDLNKQLLQSQKFESLGRIAAGVAHDFNNLITILNGHTEMLDKKNINLSGSQAIYIRNQRHFTKGFRAYKSTFNV